MADASLWKTKSIALSGGTRYDIVPVLRDATAPGTLIDSKNFQSGDKGGYSRISGYTKYDTTVVPGSGRVLGSFVFNDGVVACRGSNIYFGTGSGWGSAINPSARTNAGQYRSTEYRWSEARIVLVDGVNSPVRYNGTAAVDLTNAPSGAVCVCEFKNHLFLAKGASVYWSAPNDDTVYLSASGGGVVVVGDTVTGLKVWRSELYIFMEHSIKKLTGSSAADFAVVPVTSSIGCPFPDTIQEVAGDLLFLAPDGLRPISGTANIGDVNLAVISNPVRSFIAEQITAYRTKQIISINVAEESQYRLFFGNSNDAVADAPGLNCCLSPGAQGTTWEFFPLGGIQVSCGDSGVINSGLTQLVVHGDYSGYIYKQQYGDNFNGSNIPAFIKTPYFVFDDPDLRKTIYSVKIYVEVEGGAVSVLTCQLSLDDGDFTLVQPDSLDMTSNVPAEVAVYGFTGGTGGGSTYGTAVYGQGAQSTYRVNAIGSGFNVAFLISSNDTLPMYTIKTLIIEYAMEARQ